MRAKWDLENMTVGVLGMAFKANVDDVRDSLSFKLKDILEGESKAVLCSDPYFAGPGILGTAETIARSDLLVIATPHEDYASIDPGDKPVVDIWNILGKGRGV
jgi:UDP-N-acetyl-D-mannosaminuronic acid dehydrogenase